MLPSGEEVFREGRLHWVRWASVEVEFEVEGPGAEGVEALEGVPASVEVMVTPALLALWVQRVLALVKLAPLLGV
uniref:Uncharacterized protein n=1 Tax=Anguilla anguilla TaxID=7936 RepID=A0A0E9WI97_ANGAN